MMMIPLLYQFIGMVTAWGGGGGALKRSKVQETQFLARQRPDRWRAFISRRISDTFQLFSSGFFFYRPVWNLGLSCTAAGENYWGGKYFDCLAARKNVQAFTIQSAKDFLGPDFSAYEIIRNFCA